MIAPVEEDHRGECSCLDLSRAGKLLTQNRRHVRLGVSRMSGESRAQHGQAPRHKQQVAARKNPPDSASVQASTISRVPLPSKSPK